MNLSVEFAVILSCFASLVACASAFFAYTLTRGMVSMREVIEVRTSLEGLTERMAGQQRELHLMREATHRIESYLLHKGQ